MKIIMIYGMTKFIFQNLHRFLIFFEENKLTHSNSTRENRTRHINEEHIFRSQINIIRVTQVSLHGFSNYRSMTTKIIGSG
jgi:hypothetical protein